MKRVLINDNSLNKEDLDYKVVRVKIFFVNSNNEILLAYNNDTYQFIGGHLKKDESLEECVLRELKEETGITIKHVDTPFLNITTYDKNYFDTGKKVENSIYYYRILSDAIPDLNETSYDDIELQSEFNLFYVKLKDIEKFINNCIIDRTIDKNIAKEMLLAISEYNDLYSNF